MIMNKFFILSCTCCRSEGNVVFELGDSFQREILVEEVDTKKKLSLRLLWKKIKKVSYQTTGCPLKIELGYNLAEIIRSHYRKNSFGDLVGSVVLISLKPDKTVEVFLEKDGELINVCELAENEFTNNKPHSSSTTYEGTSFKARKSPAK